ncbi:COG3650 family protein [Vibrio sp. EJY3]|uniref:COG3650 family protein n=1 Tax=Vibrio sp. (strain EJY3) TaxID=1116375 RepID=UPI000243C120|nr:membrane protein [Vibrio sp. EJY3]AEX23476.1 putative lipoprotein [Vibrio sp. EJY3]
MKALKNPVALATLLVLQACSSQLPENGNEEITTPPASLDKPETIQPQTFMLRGEVVIGHESQYIMPCGSDKQYWLQLSPQQAQRAMSLSNEPYKPIYGEMIGHLNPPGNEGFSADFDANFVVEQVNLLTSENPQRCSQPSKPTRVFGNEPFWSASFESDALQFQQPGKPAQSITIESRQLQARQRTYQLADGELRMTENLCSDTMSDSLYGWTATLKHDGTAYQGCGMASNVDSTLEWANTYVATSTQSQGFEVQMTLKPDHSATTQYSYSDGQAPLVERGYWQQLSPSQIQVVMTHHQQQRLQSERLFIREGNQLKATQEKVGTMVYPIADGGLVLYPATVRQSGTKTSSPERSNSPISSADIPSSADFNSKVDAAVRNYFFINQTNPSNNQYRWLTYDLNGDGNEELFVQLDWCGSGGCTLLVFENHQSEWRFNSRITLVHSPIMLGQQTSHGWRDLVFNVSGGGATPAQHVMQYTGVSYPINPSMAPKATSTQVSGVRLFSDGISPVREGVRL